MVLSWGTHQSCLGNIGKLPRGLLTPGITVGPWALSSKSNCKAGRESHSALWKSTTFNRLKCLLMKSALQKSTEVSILWPGTVLVPSSASSESQQGWGSQSLTAVARGDTSSLGLCQSKWQWQRDTNTRASISVRPRLLL